MLFKFKYPKLVILILSIILAYLIFSNSNAKSFILGLGEFSYFGTFIAGMLFSFGFTSPFSAGFFIVLNPENILLTGVIGGVGALLSDLLIFSFIRVSFKDEFKRLEKTRLIKGIKIEIEEDFGKKIKVYLMYAIAGIMIASPLPDEIGVIMLAGLTKIKLNVLSVISFILNTLGILILLWI